MNESTIVFLVLLGTIASILFAIRKLGNSANPTLPYRIHIPPLPTPHPADIHDLGWPGTPTEGVHYVERWVGFHLESKGRLSASIWDDNPGSLAHVYRFRFPVPEEVRLHFLQRRECLLLDKFGKQVGPCEPSPITTTEPSQKEQP